MKDFTKGMLFVVSLACVYKLGALKERRKNDAIVIEMDDELREILDKLKAKLKKKKKGES